MADNLLATQLRKGMIVKIENKLYRIFAPATHAHTSAVLGA